MTRLIKTLLLGTLFVFATVGFGAETKEWTLLVFLNGNNNLDDFGAVNIKQMETVGSTKDINLVVQWASLKSEETKRILVQKSTDPSEVTSPAVETLPRIDMGDYKKFVEFVSWGIKNYPAKHYFIDVWNHGSGWHRRGPQPPTRDISNDEHTGNKISTKELGIAMAEISKLIGRKVDILGMDACLMAMAEVGSEVAPSVNYMIASQEIEPGSGWPYNTFVGDWARNPYISSLELSKILVRNYVQAYEGLSEVTLSALDLSQQDQLERAIRSFGQELARQDEEQVKHIREAAGQAQTFTYTDYMDLNDLIVKLQARDSEDLNRDTLTAVQKAITNYVAVNQTSERLKNASGVSIWWPTSKSNLKQYLTKYQELRFWETGWGDAVRHLF